MKQNDNSQIKVMFIKLFEKIKESVASVLPLALIVLLLSFTPVLTLSAKETAIFLISAVFLIIGIAFFNLGADLSMTPMGEQAGVGLTKTGKVKLLLLVAFFMGLLITIAEPDLSVLSEQVKTVIDPAMLIFSVGFGVGLFLFISVIKIIYKKSLSMLLMFFYLVLFSLCALLIEKGGRSLIPLCFDSGGVTTGPITVPFIMAFGVGISLTLGGREAKENSFGLIALCSIGPMVAVAVLSLFSSGGLKYVLSDYNGEKYLGSAFWGLLLKTALDVFKSLLLVLLFFLILNFTLLKLPKRKLIRIMVGIAYTFLGLVVFLTAVTVGFMPVGFKLGTELAAFKEPLMVGTALVLGMTVIFAEPAVHVLKRQVEGVTGGTVTGTSMLVALSIGVGLSLGLSVIRMIYGFSILYYIVPGYLISLGLSFFVPRIYTAIAFDSGGVASGPLTSGFILPLMIGCCAALNGQEAILSYAFGVVAMVAMTPLITIQILGFRAVFAEKMALKIAMKRILAADDEQIIYFDVKGGKNGGRKRK
ncbi:MAG: DUF1538 domain-containing protein [Lachnospiraceae bacterium]|nr:DUF1538 domain-containing protein [Lachnospiraceae bacterium]